MPGLAHDAWDALVTQLPGGVKEVLKSPSLRRGAAILLVGVVIGPILIVFLAAFWLRSMASLPIDTAQGLRRDILRVVQEGLSVEEVMTRSNARLDYFEAFNKTFQVRPTIPTEISVGVLPRQKLEIELRRLQLVAGQRTCDLREHTFPLLDVALGGQPIKVVSELDDAVSIQIDGDWWTRNLPQLNTRQTVQKLTLNPTAEARKLPCGEIHVEGSIKVFKDVLGGLAEK